MASELKAKGSEWVRRVGLEIKDGSLALITPTINALPHAAHRVVVQLHWTRTVQSNVGMFTGGGVHGLRTCVHVHTHGTAFKQSICSLCVFRGLKSSLVQKLWLHEEVEEGRTRARGCARGCARGTIPTARSDHPVRPNLGSTSGASSPGSGRRIQTFLHLEASPKVSSQPIWHQTRPQRNIIKINKAPK